MQIPSPLLYAIRDVHKLITLNKIMVIKQVNEWWEVIFCKGELMSKIITP